MSAPPRPNLRLTLPPVMTAGEVARLLGVDPKTIGRHDKDLRPFRTLGGCWGHRRYRREVVAEVAERPVLSRWSR